jgi:hypothetical protein
LMQSGSSDPGRRTAVLLARGCHVGLDALTK